MPLDITLRMCGKSEWADGLTYSSSHIIGIGIRGKAPHGKKCWLYYPEDNCPFYRCTVFSHYADANVPAQDVKLKTLCHGDGVSAPRDGGAEAKPGPYWSLMFEVSESKYKPVNWTEKVSLGGGAAGEWPKVVLDTIIGSVATELMAEDDEIVSIYHRRLEHGYPTPSLGRNAVLDKALPWLKEQRIWSRGRFGSYKYEVANQDHSNMLGVEAVDNILFGSREDTLTLPNVVNKDKNHEIHFSLDPK